ncbi:hypothetical protein ScPMuIL_003755 [Solemya velum]
MDARHCMIMVLFAIYIIGPAWGDVNECNNLFKKCVETDTPLQMCLLIKVRCVMAHCKKTKGPFIRSLACLIKNGVPMKAWKEWKTL